MSSGRWTKESAIQSTSSSSAAARSARSFSVIAEVGIVGVGQADALLVRHAPGDLDHGRRRVGRGVDDAQQHLAVVDQHAVAGRERARGFPDGADRRAWRRPASESPSRVKASPLREIRAAVRRTCRCAASAPAGRRGCRSAGRPPPRARGSSRPARACASCEAWLMLMRKTSAPAANSVATVSRSDEAGPRVAMILTRRRRRACNGVPPDGSAAFAALRAFA